MRSLTRDEVDELDRALIASTEFLYYIDEARMIDRETFFGGVRLHFGSLNETQVQGFEEILGEWENRELEDERWLAYMLATCWHETATKMQPIREMGSEAYLKRKPYYPWVGEGLVQVTWKRNAVKFGATKPGDLLNWPKALEALFDGMTKGMFTGRELGDYFSMRTDDPVHARRIINGMDKAVLIAGYHRNFMGALQPPAPAALPAKASQ